MANKYKSFLNFDIRCKKIRNYFQQIQWLKKVPSGILKHLKNRGASFVFYDNSLTNLDELKYLQGKDVDKDTEGYKRKYDDLEGLYNPVDKKVFLTNRATEWITLHELGHCVDYVFEDEPISNHDKIKNLALNLGDLLREFHVYQISIEKNSTLEQIQRFKTQIGDYFKNSDEFFAHCFMMYYHNSHTKNILKKCFEPLYKEIKFLEDQF